MKALRGSFHARAENSRQAAPRRALPKSRSDCKLGDVLGLYIVAAAILGGGAFAIVRRKRLTAARLAQQALTAEVEAIKATARAEAAALVSGAQAEAKEQLLDARHTAQKEALDAEREMQRREDELGRRQIAFAAEEARIVARATAVNEREAGLKELD